MAGERATDQPEGSEVNLVIFGATGPTGQQLVQQALGQGHQVTAVARTPNKLILQHERLRVVQGDALDPASVDRAVQGAEVVLSALGVGRQLGATTVYSEGGRNILGAMQRHGIWRFIGIGSGGVEQGDPSFGFFYKYIIKPLLLKRAYDDMARFEAYLKTSALEWIFVRPTALTDGPKTGTYRVSPRYAPPKGTTIARADLADFMLKQLQSDEYLGQTPTLAY